MKNISKIQFIVKSPLREEVKANLIQTLNMCKAMSNYVVNVKLVLPTELSDFDSINMIKTILPNYADFFKVEFVSYKPGINIFSEFDQFLKLKNSLDLSSELFFTRYPLLAIYISLKGYNVIYESHNSFFSSKKLINRFYVLFFKRISKLKNFKSFISISNNLNNFWINKGISKIKTLALHDGTNLVDKEDLKKVKFPFKNSNLTVTYAGSLYENRGLARIIKLAKTFKNLNFLVVGGPLINAKKFNDECVINSINNIFFTGPVPNYLVPSYLHNSDILLALWSKNVPTINYCSPLKVFEYMASDKLIVADGFVTIKEVLTHNKNALLVKPDDYSELQKIFNQILDAPYSYMSLGNGNRELIKSKYTWDIRCSLILKFL